MTVYRHRFDFDIGYLIKSPCKDCIYQDFFPGCMDSCMLLDRIRTVLASSVSSSRSGSPFEPHAIFKTTGEKE